MSRKPNDAGLYETLKQQEAEDDFEEISAMSDLELDAYIAANGGNPKAIRASGSALAEELLSRHERAAWKDDVDRKLEAVRKMAAARKREVVLPRAELLFKLEAARKSPRFSETAATLFHKKTLEASTDDELQGLLEQLELLAALDDG